MMYGVLVDTRPPLIEGRGGPQMSERRNQFGGVKSLAEIAAKIVADSNTVEARAQLLKSLASGALSPRLAHAINAELRRSQEKRDA
jgi:hypothetical protein